MTAKAGVGAERPRGPRGSPGEGPEGDPGRASPGGVAPPGVAPPGVSPSEGLLEAAQEADLWAHRALLSARDLHCRGLLPPSEGPSGDPPAEHPAALVAAAREDLRRAGELLRGARRALQGAAPRHRHPAGPEPGPKGSGDR